MAAALAAVLGLAPFAGLVKDASGDVRLLAAGGWAFAAALCLRSVVQDRRTAGPAIPPPATQTVTQPVEHQRLEHHPVSPDTMRELQLEAYARDVRVAYARERRAAQNLEASHLDTVRALAAAVAAKDDATGGHIQRVHALGMLLACSLCPEDVADPQLAYGFLLHDIGKLAVPDAVLTKPGPLDEEEWELMRGHPDAGVRILEAIPFLDRALGVVRHHHERWDGRGYPSGLAGDAIPPWARLFAVVDALDAMTADRPYRRGLPYATALARIAAQSGRQFDPDCVAALLALPAAEVRALLQPPALTGAAAP